MSEWIGFIFIVFLGTLFHFIYEWSNHNKYVAYFCAVNESTWEHMKLVMGPTFLWILIEIPFFGSNPNFCLSKFMSLLSMLIIIPTTFYLYMAIFKKDILFLDISLFVFSVFCGQYISNLILNLDALPYVLNYISLILLVIVFIYYMTHTFMPKKNFLFVDPINKKYGLKAHMDKDEYENLKNKHK